MGNADAAGLLPAVAHIHAGAAQHDVEVHAVDSDGRVVLDTQIDVLLDTESEVAVLAEVLAPQLVLTDLKRLDCWDLIVFCHSIVHTLSPLSRISSALGPLTVQ